MYAKNKRYTRGFTIIELITVIVIIGILATITYISYNGISAKVRDTSVLSDIDAMDAIQTNYSLGHNGVGITYYSGNPSDVTALEALGFRLSEGNVIDVVVDGTKYCIRGYNENGTKKSITDAFIKESLTDLCAKQLGPSISAITYSVYASKVINGLFEYAPSFVAAQTTSGKWMDGTATGSSTWQPNAIHAGFGGAAGDRSAKFDSTNAHSGSNALKIHINTGAYIECRVNAIGYFVADGMSLQPNTTYTYSAWMKSENVTGSASGQNIKLMFANSSGGAANVTFSGSSGSGTSSEFGISSSYIAINKVWTQYSGTFTTSSTVAWFHPEYRAYGHNGAATLSGDFWFDDIIVSKAQ